MFEGTNLLPQPAANGGLTCRPRAATGSARLTGCHSHTRGVGGGRGHRGVDQSDGAAPADSAPPPMTPAFPLVGLVRGEERREREKSKEEKRRERERREGRESEAVEKRTEDMRRKEKRREEKRRVRREERRREEQRTRHSAHTARSGGRLPQGRRRLLASLFPCNAHRANVKVSKSTGDAVSVPPSPVSPPMHTV